MYSLLWSEHCAYKHSKKLLRTLPTDGPHVVMGPGENAGAVDVGSGLVCAFKVESHNHPSAVEPFQGAATGVGGILRDIFAIGARPIAVLDSLRFGEPLHIGAHPADEASSDTVGAAARAGGRARYLLDGAVSGIGHYGNSIGVPTVGGEVYFEGPYEHNPLVNAMALGLASRERLVRSAASRARQRRDPVRRRDRARRHRRRLGARLRRARGRSGRRGSRRRRPGQASHRPGRRSVRGEEAARVLAGAARAGLARLPAGSRRGRADLRGRRDGLEGRCRHRHRRGARSAARAPHGPVRDHDQRVPGAHALRRRARARAGGSRPVRQVGGRQRRDRDCHRQLARADLRRRAPAR